MLDGTSAAREQTRIFVARCVHSLDDLLVLLHLHAERHHSKGIASIAWATQLDGETTAVSLQRLVACDLVRPAGEGESLTYTYGPNSGDLDAAVNDLARLYAHSRFDVISWIAADAMERIRDNARLTFARVIRATRSDEQ